MLRLNYVLVLCVIYIFQSVWAETVDDTEELDEEFLEMLGSFEAEEEDWYDFFWSTLDEAEQPEIQNVENE